MMTPDGAKAKLDEMVQSGQVSRETLQSLTGQAQQVARMMGLK